MSQPNQSIQQIDLDRVSPTNVELSVPVTWNMIKAYGQNPLRFTGMPRYPKVAEALKEIQQVPLEARTNDLIQRLGFTRKDKVYALIDNPFPYAVSPGITHKLLFINPEVHLAYDRPDVVRYLVTSHAWKLGYRDSQYFENPPELDRVSPRDVRERDEGATNVERKSLSSLPHYHVFMRGLV